MISQTPPSKRHIRLHLLPQTAWGWWSVGLLLTAILLFLATIFVAQAVDQPDYAGFPLIASAVATVSGGVAATVSVLRHHERGALVLAPLIIGLFLAVFIIGETISPTEPTE